MWASSYWRRIRTNNNDYLKNHGKIAQNSAKAAAKKRIVKVDAYGDAHINATFNNIIISLTNKSGQVISWSSAGKMGFKGLKRTPLTLRRWLRPMPPKWRLTPV
jgi:hypothetical protein